MKNILFRIAAFLLYLISLFPLRVLYIFSDILYLVLFYLVGYRRKVVETNLKNAFPEKSAGERKKIAKKFYHFLADMIVESVKMFSISREEIKKRFHFSNLDQITGYFKEEKSVLVAMGHYGNWEWGNLALPVRVDERVLIVYKPLTDKKFEAFINKMRSRFGGTLVAMKQTMRKIVEFKNENTVTILVNDQTPARPDVQFFLPFLNQPTAVLLGIEKIAKTTGYPVVYGYIDRIKRGHYQANFKTLTDNPKATAEYEITRMHIRELEEIIRKKPELWLWSHRRWKFKPEDIA